MLQLFHHHLSHDGPDKCIEIHRLLDIYLNEGIEGSDGTAKALKEVTALQKHVTSFAWHDDMT